MRGITRWWLGRDGWRDDLSRAVELVRRTDPLTLATVVAWKYGIAVSSGSSSPTTPRYATPKKRLLSLRERATIPRSA